MKLNLFIKKCENKTIFFGSWRFRGAGHQPGSGHPCSHNLTTVECFECDMGHTVYATVLRKLRRTHTLTHMRMYDCVMVRGIRKYI